MADETDAGTAQSHDLSVAYLDVVLDKDQIEPSEFTPWTEKDEDGIHYYVAGPCPGCRADVQGHALDRATGPSQAQSGGDPERADEQGEAPFIEVAVACSCGFGHGNQAAKSCGRQWLLELSKDDT